MRARNIKPGFYKNEKLVECSVWARLLAPGLWMMADREGRLLDKPKQIKMEVFPADSIEVEPLLQELHTHQHILRYEIDGIKYIQILGFKEHQSPHFTEKGSILPPPIRGSSENKISSSEEIPKALPPDSLIPDSLIPDCSANAEMRARDFILPEWIPPEVWDGFMEVRKAKKAADTVRVKRSIVSQLERFRARGHDPTEIIEKSIRNSWKDVFEPEEKSYAKSHGYNGKSEPSRSKTGESLAALYEAGNRVIKRRGMESPAGEGTALIPGLPAGDANGAYPPECTFEGGGAAGDYGLPGKTDVALPDDQHERKRENHVA